MAYAALVSLDHTIDRVIDRHHSPIVHTLNQLLLSIRERASFMRSFLERSLKDVNDLEGRIREVGNKAEDIIEHLLYDAIRSGHEWIDQSVRSEAELERQLREVAEEIESIGREAMEQMESLREVAEEIGSIGREAMEQMESREYFRDWSSSRSMPLRSMRYYGGARDVVGFEEDNVSILDRLSSSESKLQVLPILGTGGIGKTTLAKLVFDSTLIEVYFPIRVWVTLSQEYSLKTIHSKLLASMNLEKSVGAESDEDKIREYLGGKKYLVVMDDMWSKKTWDDMKMLFPDYHNGSRIVITTRLPDVAAYPDPSSPIHAMKLLNEEDSWILLERRVFGGSYCPPELQIFGKKIAENCGGLPLSIVLVAGLLSGINLTARFWEQIAANDGKLETVLWLSYTYLPPPLRACFLYMGGFPEDYEIRVSELIKLWAAERFMLQRRYEELEETAEMYLEDLMERNLVLISSMKSDRRIKSCSLHDMVRDFCIRQARKEKLHLSVMDHLPTPILRRHFLPRVIQNYPRVSLTSHDLNVNNSIHGSCIRTIICIQQRGYKSVGSVENFSSLRVMHVLRGGNDVCDWELGQVFNLVHLSYLASPIPTSIVPPTISSLRNLQTLNIYRFDVCLPVEIWRMRRLRHLIAFSFHSLPYPEEDAFPLEELQTLSLVKEFVCSKRIINMIPNVKKLGICLSYEAYQLHNLEFSLKLEKLKLEMSSDALFGSILGYAFPPCLRNLTLSGLRIPWSDMTIVGSLPDLRVLKLRNYACDGECWETNDGEFMTLEVLLIDGSNLRYWDTESSHFPVLRHLSIISCPYLFQIPDAFGDIPTNELIEVDDENIAVLESAKWIKEEQEDFGNYDLRVRVKRY